MNGSESADSKIQDPTPGDKFDRERGAGDLSETWGYKRRYDEEQLEAYDQQAILLKEIFEDPRAEEGLAHVLRELDNGDTKE